MEKFGLTQAGRKGFGVRAQGANENFFPFRFIAEREGVFFSFCHPRALDDIALFFGSLAKTEGAWVVSSLLSDVYIIEDPLFRIVSRLTSQDDG